MDGYGGYQVNIVTAAAAMTDYGYRYNEDKNKKKKFEEKQKEEKAKKDGEYVVHTTGYGPRAAKTEFLYQQRNYN